MLIVLNDISVVTGISEVPRVQNQLGLTTVEVDSVPDDLFMGHGYYFKEGQFVKRTETTILEER